MNKIFKRVTVIEVSGDKREAAVIYKKKSGRVSKAKRRTSTLLRPIENAVRHVWKAGTVAGADGYDRHLKSAKRRNRWLMDAPSNIMKTSRKAYNEARKGVPFRVLPKVN